MKNCSYPGCQSPCHKEHEYCNKAHGEQHKKMLEQQESKDEPYYEFTNFYPSPVNINGLLWPTTEHYFQAMKFNKFPKATEYIRKELKTAREAFDFSRNKGKRQVPPIREDWEKVKVNVMKEALLAKFKQHEKLKRLLLYTDNKQIVEHTVNDKFWADGGDGTGKNMLGQLLMQVRQQLRQEEEQKMEEISAVIPSSKESDVTSCSNVPEKQVTDTPCSLEQKKEEKLSRTTDMQSGIENNSKTFFPVTIILPGIDVNTNHPFHISQGIKVIWKKEDSISEERNFNLPQESLLKITWKDYSETIHIEQSTILIKAGEQENRKFSVTFSPKL